MKKVEVLGTGCPKCKKTKGNVLQAAKKLGAEIELEEVKDTVEIVKRGAPLLPALTIDGKIKVAGRIPTVEEIKKMLRVG